MPSTRSQRSAATLEELRAAVRSEFGPSARILSAEKITTGGLGGLFRKHHYEATIEVPDPADDPTVRVAIAADRTARVGILALLEDAEAQEDRLADPRRGRRAAPVEEAAGDELTERSDAFASLMDDFTFNGLAPAVSLADALDGRAGRDGAAPALPTDVPNVDPSGATPSAAASTSAPATPAEERAAFEALTAARGVDDGAFPTPPAVRRADGDLVAVVGRAEDASAVASLLAAVFGLRLVPAPDRRSAILARAVGVQDGCGSVTAFAWPLGVRAGSMDAAAALEGVAPDQVWVVVDAGRKHEDTARDVRSVAAAVPVAGLVVVGADATSSPDTVHMLGLPTIDVRSLSV